MLPKQYAWLNNIGTLPKTIQEGLKLYGTTEASGSSNNPIIMQWARELKASKIEVSAFTGDVVPWCGLFAAIVALRSGKDVPKYPLSALNWSRFGEKVKKAGLGDVLVFSRNGGGHVGFYIGEDASYYHVLGGNQSNKVNILRIKKSRLHSIRRPVYNIKPETVKSYQLASVGIVSENEA